MRLAARTAGPNDSISEIANVFRRSGHGRSSWRQSGTVLTMNRSPAPRTERRSYTRCEYCFARMNQAMPMNRLQFQGGLSLPGSSKRYGTDVQCAEALEKARWPSRFRCPLFSPENLRSRNPLSGAMVSVRAAVNMRTLLSEFGCLPVSATIHIPKAQDVLKEDGPYTEGVNADDWAAYCERAFTQLTWWPMATKRHLAAEVGRRGPTALTRSRFQRNAP